jgi:hypothetical protein
MAKSRRQFLAEASIGLLGAAVASTLEGQQPSPSPKPTEPTPGAPPAFGTAPPVGPEVSPATFSEAEKLMRVELTPAELQEAAGNWRMAMAPLYERRTGPRKTELEPTLAPYSRWNPVLPGETAGPQRDVFVWSKADPGPLPKNDEDIAFAPLTRLSRWIETRKLTSERLTNIYLERLKRFNPQLRCVITLTSDLAMAQAKRADQEIAAGKYRGPLHGVPWGGKDLLDTAGIPTTYGAEPYRNRVPKDDESMAAGRRIVRIKRRSGISNVGGPGRLLHRQRDGRKHREPQHALRNHWVAPDLRARRENRSNDALLVPRQTGSHDSPGGRYHAGAARHQRP